MQRGPAPQVGRDLAAVQQEPAEHFGVTAARREMHGRGAVLVLLRQAYVGAAHLWGRGRSTEGRGLGARPLLAPPPSRTGPASPGPQPRPVPELTSHTMTGLWPICAAACSGVMPSWALRCGSAPHSCTRYCVTSRWPSWHARYRGVAPFLVWAFTPLRKTQHPPRDFSARPPPKLSSPLTRFRGALEGWEGGLEKNLVAGPGCPTPSGLSLVPASLGVGGGALWLAPHLPPAAFFLQCTSD